MAAQAANELLSVQKSSDSGLQVALHPLPILEISDFIARGYQRGFKGAVVGALLGQQNGREITIEHSFSCKSTKNAHGFYELDLEWFKQRLDQMKLVHKSPLLDLVGWYTLVPKTGPTALHLPIHQQISAVNESAVLLGFHIEDILSPAAGDPLPITIYESNMEAEDSAKEPAEGEDREMKDAEAPARMVLRFRKLPYTTETGEAEMIAMQFIREGGANAMVDTTERHILEQFDKKIAVDDGKGKRRAVAYDEAKQQQQQATSRKEAPDQSTAVTNPDANLDRVEAEYMAALQAKFNAVKMMKSRLALITAYLQRLPPGGAPADQAQQQQKQPSFPPSTTTAATTTPSNTILRHIQALVTNLDLVAPAEQATVEREMQREANDVHLLSMLSDLLSSVSQVREAGKKFSVLEMSRHNRQGRGGGGLAPLTASPFDPGFGVPPGEIGVGGGDAEPGF